MGHPEPWGLRARWWRFLLLLLAALLATHLLVVAPLARAGESPPPAFIELDGRRGG